MPRKEEDFFHTGEQEAQKRYGNPGIWNEKRRQKLLWREIPQEFYARLEDAPFFFLATSDDQGHCDCSFKGGGAGLIKVISGRKIAFPDFSGNGAFMSIGNILRNPHVGLLFIDFSDGARLRVNGRASIHETGEVMRCFHKAKRVIVVDIEQVVPNCANHVPHLIPAQDREMAERGNVQ